MSTRVTTGMVQRNILSDLHNVTERLTRTQQKVASSKEITRPSDDPFNASRALALREELDGVRQYQRNATDAVGWQDATELALARITEAVGRTRDLLVQGASDGTDAVSRESIAQEIDQLVAAVKQNANATYRGRHLFAGTDTGSPPYADGAVDAYQGDAGMIARQIGPSVSLDVNVLGSTVLGSGQAAGDDKLLHVLRDIADHMRAGDGASLRGTDLARLEQNLDGLLGVRALNGARSNRLEAAQARLAEVEETTLTHLSMTEDADIARTLIDLNSQQAAYQAALRAGANIVQSSLMDFLR
jgi:flagellar hook-associated protein 3 FlgL